MRRSRRHGIFGLTTLLWVGLSALAATAQAKQQTSNSEESVVALSLDTASCPAVSSLSLVSLEWNPVFEHGSSVTSINHFGLVFAPVAADGVTVITHPNGAYSHYVARSVSATLTANGYYHVEFHFSKTLPPGLYRVVDADAVAGVRPEYNGLPPRMTFSPARDRLCITVVSHLPSSSRTKPATWAAH